MLLLARIAHFRPGATIKSSKLADFGINADITLKFCSRRADIIGTNAPLFNVEDSMHNNGDVKNWKQEQINYFKEYLKAFSENTREYHLIKKGIEDLERSS